MLKLDSYMEKKVSLFSQNMKVMSTNKNDQCRKSGLTSGNMDSISTKSFKKCPMRTLVCPIRALVPVHNNPDMNQRWSKVVITSMYFLMISLKMHFKNTGKSQVWIFEHMQLPNIQSFIGEYVLLWKHQGRGF